MLNKQVIEEQLHWEEEEEEEGKDKDILKVQHKHTHTQSEADTFRRRRRCWGMCSEGECAAKAMKHKQDGGRRLIWGRSVRQDALSFVLVSTPPRGKTNASRKTSPKEKPRRRSAYGKGKRGEKKKNKIYWSVSLGDSHRLSLKPRAKTRILKYFRVRAIGKS